MRQQLERQSAPQPLVAREVNFAHPAYAEHGDHLIGSKLFSYQRDLPLTGQMASRDIERRSAEKWFGLCVCFEKRFDLSP
jgi:hypothetical protein